MHRMIYWNFQRKQMREQMRAYAEKQQAKRNTETYFGEVYLYEGNLVKVSYRTSPETAVGEILNGKDKGKTTTIYLSRCESTQNKI